MNLPLAGVAASPFGPSRARLDQVALPCAAVEPSRVGAIAAMAHVSLIVVNYPDTTEAEGNVQSWREALIEAGHSLEVILVGPLRAEDSTADQPMPTRGAGLSAHVIDGLRAASGDVRVVIDGCRTYHAVDLPRLVEPLIDGRAHVAVADGGLTGWRALAAIVLRPISGSADPFSGLIAINRQAFERVQHSFKPVGRRFAFEILARARGTRIDVPVEAERSVRFPALRLDDLRHIKRISDDRLGNVSRLLQFCVVGASGMVVDLSFYALFQWLFGMTSLAEKSTRLGPLSLACAAALSIGLALTWNFTLNRYLTFSYAKKGSLLRQFVTYVLSNALGIALSFTLRLTLPRHVEFFAKHRLAAAVVGIVAATGISFSMSRWLVFRPHSPKNERSTPALDATATEPVAAPAEPVCPEVV
jgi:dolichol-phosphate mannosyltransferase